MGCIGYIGIILRIIFMVNDDNKFYWSTHLRMPQSSCHRKSWGTTMWRCGLLSKNWVEENSTGTPKFHGEHPWIIVDVPLNHLESVHWHVTYVGYTVLPCYISMFHVSSSLFWCLGDLPRYHRGPRHSEPMATTLSMLKVKRLLVRLHGWFVFHVGCWWNVWCILYFTYVSHYMDDLCVMCLILHNGIFNKCRSRCIFYKYVTR